jgi:hypothetical protein
MIRKTPLLMTKYSEVIATQQETDYSEVCLLHLLLWWITPQAARPEALFLIFPLKISILEGFPECGRGGVNRQPNECTDGAYQRFYQQWSSI